jgi:putative drug exporter of the RND superfamily
VAAGDALRDVFGLSMDYEAFLVSRIHEDWIRPREPSQAIVEGVGTTAG